MARVIIFQQVAPCSQLAASQPELQSDNLNWSQLPREICTGLFIAWFAWFIGGELLFQLNQSQDSEPKIHLVPNFGLYYSNYDSESTGPQSETRDLGIKSAVS